MRNIFDWLAHLEKDKVLHFTLSLVIALLAGVIAKALGGGSFAVLMTAWIVGFVAGVGKEIYDVCGGGRADKGDFLADTIGTALGTLTAYLLVL